MNDDIKPYNYFYFALCIILGVLLATAIITIPMIYLRESSYYDIEILGVENVLGGLCFLPIFLFMPLYIIFMIAISTKISGIGKQRFLPIITSIKQKVNSEYLDVTSLDDSVFYSADDEKLIVRHKDRKTYIITLVIATIATTLAGIYGVVDTKNGLNIFWLDLSFVFILYLFYNILYPAKEVVFDRMTGLVTIPGLFVFPSQKVPFEKVKQGNVFFLAQKIMGIINTFTWTATTIPGRMNNEWWSFYVWYMDKNRPLPHGTLFEAYREKDFFRRQAEGFPPPLYESWPTVTISDDRYGYVYGSEKFKSQQRLFRVNIAAAYQKVFNEMWKKDKTLSDEAVTLIGIYNQCYVFRLKAPKNQKFKLLEESDLPNDSLFVDGKKGEFFDDYRDLK